MKIKLAIFDLAGTTVEDHNDVPRILQETLAKFDIYVTLEEAIVVMGIPKPVAIRQLLLKYGDDLLGVSNDTIREIYEAFRVEMLSFYKNDEHVSEKAGVSETFRLLKQNNVKIAIDTGFDRGIANTVMERLGWLEKGLVDFSVTSDEVMRGRPFPDMVFKAMEYFDINDPKDVAKIGDTTSDLSEGNSAGCGFVIGITSGAFSRDVLEKEEHTHLIDSIPDLIPILSFSSETQKA